MQECLPLRDLQYFQGRQAQVSLSNRSEEMLKTAALAGSVFT